MRRSGSFPAILAIASTMAVAAAIAPAVPAAAASPTTFYAFGTNQRGEFGNGTTSSAANVSPTRASVPGTISQLTTGMRATGALLTDGTVWTWGENYYSQLGYNTGGAVVTTPRQVPGLSGITQLAMSDEGNGYAVGAGGNVWAWGDNSHGQLGNGSTSSSITPILVPGLSGITQVAAGPYYVLARGSDGSVWAWGDNASGSLGDGTTTDRSIPQRLQSLSGITQVVAALVSYAVRSDGTLFSWGTNTVGQLGHGTTGGFSATPAPVSGVIGVTQVASSGVSALAISGTAERLFAWGDNGCGELGDGTTTSKSSPELIGMVGVSQVMQGIAGILSVSSAAIRYDGKLWTWGCNGTGRLANGTTAGTSTPAMVTSLKDVTQFTFGDDTVSFYGAYSLAIGTLAGTVPNLIGDTKAQASAALTTAGLVLGSVSSVVDYTCNNIGRVRSQNPSAGTSVVPGSAVSVTLGTAPPPPHQCP